MLDVLMKGTNYCDDGFIAAIEQRLNRFASTIYWGSRNSKHIVKIIYFVMQSKL